MTLCAVPVAKRGWIVPLAMESVEAFMLICLQTGQRTVHMTKKHKLSSCLMQYDVIMFLNIVSIGTIIKTIW